GSAEGRGRIGAALQEVVERDFECVHLGGRQVKPSRAQAPDSGAASLFRPAFSRAASAGGGDRAAGAWPKDGQSGVMRGGCVPVWDRALRWTDRQPTPLP
ncbi:MAG: hypothetical protein ACO305_08050, partial [Rubrivivax sp.]